MRLRSPAILNQTMGLVRNYVHLRTQWLRKMLDSGRNIEEECGHPEVVDISDYRRKFDRGDIGYRIVSLYPDESWALPPEIYETEDATDTEFETAWKALDAEHHLMSMMLRADILSGIGRYGVILIGIDDGKSLEEPIDAVEQELVHRMNASAARKTKTPEPVPPEAPVHQLLYLRSFDESLVIVKDLESDPRHPRFGQPRMYEIKLWTEQIGSSESLGHMMAGLPGGPHVAGTTMRVHWTRIIHLADNRTTDEIFGTPRMKVCYNRVLDLHKVCGGSAEMFWKGGFPGLALETQPTDEPVALDKEATKAEMEQYYNNLQRYIALEGMTAKSLAPQVADPSMHGEIQLKLICISLGVPLRVFAGTEEGKLASGQDMVAWKERMKRRQVQYNEPLIIRPFVDRLITCGILPRPADSVNGRPQYLVYWPDLLQASKDQLADRAEKVTNALSKYVSSGADAIFPLEQYLEKVQGMDRAEVEAIMDEIDTRMLDGDLGHGEEDEDEELMPPPRKGLNGNPGKNGNGAAKNGHAKNGNGHLKPNDL